MTWIDAYLRSAARARNLAQTYQSGGNARKAWLYHDIALCYEQLAEEAEQRLQASQGCATVPS